MKKDNCIVKLLITLDFPPGIGGIQKYLFSIVKYCYTENDRVFVGGIKGKNCDNNQSDISAKVKYFYTPLSRINSKLSLISMIFSYICLSKRYKNELNVECGNIYAAIIPWICSGVTKQQYSIYTYGTELIALNKKSFKNMLLKMVFHKAKKVFTISLYSKKIIQRLGIEQEIDIIHPRIELPKEFKDFKKKDNNIYSILSVGRLVQHKGHTNLIAAAKILLEKEKEYRFIILGDGPLYTTLKVMSESLGIEEYMSIKENLSDELVYDEFSKADLFVLPSIETSKGVEGFGIVLLEAMAFHVPIVASASGGIPEVLDNGSCGILVEPGNTDQLAKAIHEIRNNPSIANKIEQSAYKRLMAKYVWK
jgi:glycosyltransferase involved in cell wall biosynthesis